jgi:hypothetical protein
VGEVHVTSPIALASQGKDSVGAGADPAADVARQVNSEEWEAGIRDRVYSSAHLPGGPWLKREVVPTEWDYPEVGAHTSGPGQQFRLQTATIDQSAGGHDPAGPIRLDRCPTVPQAQNLPAELEVDPELDQSALERFRDLPVVNQSRLGNPESEQARDAGLMGANAGGI